MSEKNYFKRIADKILDFKLDVFGAVNIVGPKWCGKTRTAKEKSKSELLLQKSNMKNQYLYIAKTDPEFLLEGDKPKLIDEWQDAPELWDAVRVYCDDHEGTGHYILTGSTSRFVKTSHTGTGRISTMKMYPMSLYESLESTGEVSLKELFDKKELNKTLKPKLNLEELIFAACRGGWPESINIKSKEGKLAIAKDYFRQIYTRDIFCVDNVKRNPNLMRLILRSYARNISTLAKKNLILNDVNSNNSISSITLDDYIEVLEKLYIVEDIYGWSPNIRSKTAIRSGRKREFIDPSIAVAALSGSPEVYKMDLNTFGFIFETLCIRDLKVYSDSLGGEISYYHDNLDLEVDCVLHLDDGRYALIEFKLGFHEIEDAAKNLNKIERLIKEHNKNSKQKIREPDLKMIITGNTMGFKREDGIFVIPISSLKD